MPPYRTARVNVRHDSRWSLGSAAVLSALQEKIEALRDRPPVYVLLVKLEV
jgi:hypothetical protein